ncbi:hypothetical protein GQ42DRAFT_157567 [Ramicandelaber brevisporus]|nr:hypothetical protein GQ42DRAFT_157567 [Ramicandelaber brevisporus]
MSRRAASVSPGSKSVSPGLKSVSPSNTKANGVSRHTAATGSKWLCNQLHQAIRKACPDVEISDLSGGNSFECNDCHRSKPGSADSTNTTDTAAETDNLARIFTADPGAIELFVGSSSFTPLFFVHRLYLLLVSKLMGELRLGNSTPSTSGKSADTISKSQKRQARRLKKQLADFLYSGGVHYSLSRSRWQLKKGGKFKALAKEYVNNLELNLVVAVRNAVRDYLESDATVELE